MARNEIDELSVIGFDAATVADLADQIQRTLVDPFAGNGKQVKIVERYNYQPAFDGANYGALFFYIVSEKPKEEADTTESEE